jgi:hypothetical protein
MNNTATWYNASAFWNSSNHFWHGCRCVSSHSLLGPAQVELHHGLETLKPDLGPVTVAYEDGSCGGTRDRIESAGLPANLDYRAAWRGKKLVGQRIATVRVRRPSASPRDTSRAPGPVDRGTVELPPQSPRPTYFWVPSECSRGIRASFAASSFRSKAASPLRPCQAARAPRRRGGS